MSEVAFEPAGEWTTQPLRPITPAVFKGFAALIYREAGIHLSEAKQALLVGRLSKRVRALALPGFREYLDRVSHDATERVEMLNCIATNETHFFREPNHFVLLRERVLPNLLAAAAAGQRPKSIRVWSAGCSTGEEPYSLAMLLRDTLGDGWNIDILATDISTRVLDSARAGFWPVRKSKEIPAPYLKRFMLKGTRSQEGTMKAGEDLRGMIRFLRLNLNEEQFRVERNFDLIFCRNVLIYFDADSKRGVINRLVSHLAPKGLLFVGHAESLNGVTDAVRCVTPTVYARPGESHLAQ
ncbi:MAG TPA: protein-glutamate O-methyltransferase [Thermoanaerobaculia bacterium]|jgi:chemotaxis protein methyltransferase CheR